ncbi:hypothetical protein AAU57_04505 [Nonlabens sp. YIK11]|uniref:hypothetical protein n=1 Tax=Nonlabens sp. YIK11 TaxID=1453349 RepID=UPI0006DC79A2|nr:hypothetical protein [Nonlabens sp. YIK11]KQC32664.1 hypothetical protein AAU57_04505 [Nonlabens sp. YIK11]
MTEYSYVYKQKSLNEKYAIYQYSRPGLMAFSSDITGTRLLPINKEFSEKNGIEINGRIKQWISEDTLEIYRFNNPKDFEQPKDTLKKVYYEKAYDLTLKVVENDRINAGRLQEKYFDSLKINQNKITFFGLKHKFGPKPINEIETYNLGDFKILSIKDSIQKIEHHFLEKGMDLKYHNSDGTITENLPRIEIKTVWFYPTKKLKTNDYNEKNGIFNEIKTNANNGYK